jgi:hypothetical protein
MTSKFSILPAAFAIVSFAALPALAQSATPASPATPAPTVSGAVESGVHADAKSHGIDERKAKDKAAQNKKKTHEQLAAHPGVSGKADSAVKADTMSKDAGSK